MTSDPGIDAEDAPISLVLSRRAGRMLDLAAENRALSMLAESLASDPVAVAPQVVDELVMLGHAGSAGLTLVVERSDRQMLRWHAVAGALSHLEGRVFPFEKCPGSAVIQSGLPKLMMPFDRTTEAWLDDQPMKEALVVPVELKGQTIGALWVVDHGSSPPFDAGLLDLMRRLSRFVSAAARNWTQFRDPAVNEARAGRDSAAAIGASNQDYRELCHAIEDAYCVVEVSFDEKGQADDYEILDVNPAFDRITGMKNAVGTKLSDLGELKEHYGLELYARIARSGQAERFEIPALSPDRVFTGNGFRIGEPSQNRVAILFHDATERTRLEETLRASEGQQAFLLRFVEALRPLSDPIEVQSVAAGALGEYLGVDRSFYSEFDPESCRALCRRDYLRGRPGGGVATPPLPQWSVSIPRLQRGQPVVVSDCAFDHEVSLDELLTLRAVDVASFISVPMIKHGTLSGTMTVSQACPREWTAEEVWLVREVAESTWSAVERTRSAAALRDSEMRFRLLANSVPSFVWLASGDGRLTFMSDRGCKFLGVSQETLIGEGWKNILHPDDVTIAHKRWNDSCKRGVRYEVEGRYRRKDGVYRWMLGRAEPMRNEAGVVTTWFGSTTDIDDLRRLQEHQKLLLAELQHRVRNTLAVVRSIARRTATTSHSTEEFVENFDGRLDAFARTQAVVTRDPSRGVGLDYIVAEELLAFAAHERAGGRESGQLRIEGPEVRLQPKAAELIALAVHELATNAVKHGALAASGVGRGRVAIIWRIDPLDSPSATRQLVFTWVEHQQGASVGEPSHRGFGMELLERTLEYDLKAKTTVSFEPNGFSCTILLPLTSQVAFQGVERFEG